MKISDLLNFQSNRIRLEDIRNNRKNIVPFVGSGISKGCGLFTWGELLHKLAVDYLCYDEIATLEEKNNFFEYADKLVEVTGNSDIIMKRIRDIFVETKRDSSELPFLIVSSFSQMIVTTNYDDVLEIASQKSNLGYLKPLLPCLIGQVNETIQVNDRRLLKLHGSVEETQSFVFTSKQYKNFYGERNKRDNKLLPEILVKIFSSKKVLFVGSSLEKDYTLDILEECIQKNHSIFHYAIVPFPKEHDQQILKNRKLSSLGIEPIYYPEGEFDSINHLISYLSEDNNFVSAVRKFMLEFIMDDQIKENEIGVLSTILKESFYKTSLKFSTLLDLENISSNFYDDILMNVGATRKQTETLYDICIGVFKIYIEKGYIHYKTECLNYFVECFSNLMLTEGDIEEILYKHWNIERFLKSNIDKNISWIMKLSNDDVDKYANDILKKMQYKNGMEFTDIVPIYELAKGFIAYLSKKINFNNRIRLLNSIGAFGHYFGDVEGAVKHLEVCISEIEKSGLKDKQLMLFKSKCYANLAIARSLNRKNNDVSSILEACQNDISLKKEYNESDLLLSRSLNFYATILKEVDPFKACDIYIEVAEMKKKIIMIETENSELLASWATTLFNIGLLAKDIELYEISYKIICIANKYRFHTVNYDNRDYCSSINVRAELEIFVHEKRNLNWLIEGVKSRVDLPFGFSETLTQTWYVCAYYYFSNKDYRTAIKYINKSIEYSNKENALYDFRQHIRTLLLLGKIKFEQSKGVLKEQSEAEDIYITAINDIISIYGKESFYLCEPYRYMLQLELSKEKKYVYYQSYNYLKSLFDDKINEIQDKLEHYLIDILNVKI